MGCHWNAKFSIVYRITSGCAPSIYGAEKNVQPSQDPKSKNKKAYTITGPLKSFPIKDNLINLAVIEI